jgi:aspartate/glutamate racemase
MSRPTDTGRPLVVGVLGGMGPMATVETFRRITDAVPVVASRP